jgi:hypothetical protein
VANGNAVLIGQGTLLYDIAFDPSGNLFGVDSANLYQVDTTTGTTTVVGPLGGISGIMNSLVFGNDGVLYGASDQLYRINANTAAVTSIGPIGFTSAGDLAFLNGVLYLTTTSNQLATVNTTTGAGTAVGPLGVTDMFGLAAPGDGNLYGVASTNVYNINPVTGAAALAASYGGQNLIAAYGAAFRTEAQTGVPEPSSFFLLGGGLLAAVFLRKMKS